MYYMAMDGGGTKLVGILFDGDFNLISVARTNGTHASVYPPDEIEAHISECYRKLIEGLPSPIHIDKLYIVCGGTKLYRKLVPNGMTLGEILNLIEPVSGLYAGALKTTGYVALAGTGSDVFCVENSEMTDAIGGWGAILGDEGSGVWMSRLAISKAIRYKQGWGTKTSFGETVKEHYGYNDLTEYIDYIYGTRSPFRRLAELLPLVAKTARDGDNEMLDVFIQGGKMMAEQMTALLKNNPDMPRNITACGGAWKAHKIMAETFEAEVKKSFPDAVFTLPVFEHVMAGPVCLAMEMGMDMTKAEQLLKQNFKKLIWNKGW